MKKVTMYKSENGKLFGTKAECLDYESKVEDAEAATEMLRNGDTLREALIRANRTTPWWDIKLTPEEKDLLGKITTGTCISVPSWQCSEKPCYKVTRIDPEGFVYLWGEDDRWQRPYGNWVVIGDLLRYARQTFTMSMFAGEQEKRNDME